MEKMMVIREAQYKELFERAEVAEAEAAKFQEINDELIKRVLTDVHSRVSGEKVAIEMRDKQIEQLTKYTEELRSYISSLQDKVCDLKRGLHHHKERHIHFMNKAEELQKRVENEESNPRLVRENEVLKRRVNELYNAIDQIDDIVQEVI